MKPLSYFITALLVFVMFCLSQPVKAQYQPPDSCLKLIRCSGEYPLSNPDSVKIDSCEDSPTYEEVYAKEYFVILFDNSLKLRNNTFPPDTTFSYTWRDIDTIYKEIREDFKNIEHKYGKFYFYACPERNFVSTQVIFRHIYIKFSNYINIDNVCDDLEDINEVRIVQYCYRYCHEDYLIDEK